MKNKNILVVDDTETNIDILVELLSDTYEISVALDGHSALEIVEDEDISLILLDIMMPEMDGYEVCRILKSNDKTKDIPVIFITAKTDENSIEKAYDVGGIDYVTKPFKAKELMARIKTQLQLRYLQHKEIEYTKNIAISELIRNISHQWRQPLSVISTTASGMSMQKEIGILEEDNILPFCTTIVENTKYLSEIIDNFKDFTDNSELTSFNLKELIDKNHKLLFSNISDIEIIVEIEEDINIENYPSQLLQVILAIVTNSIDNLNEIEIDKKLIFFTAFKNDKEVIINIYDNGMGIAKEVINRVFEPYFTTKHKSQGKGLGLYIVQNIVIQSLNGSVDVSNLTFEYKDRCEIGANFEIILPF